MLVAVRGPLHQAEILLHEAAERAERMLRGAPPKLEADTRKSTQVAMDEIMHDLIEWDYGPAPEESPEETAAEA